VVNSGTVPLTGIEVVVGLDPALERSEGAAASQTSWTIPILAPGARSDPFEIKCRGKLPTPRACVRVRATPANGMGDEKEACVEIRSAPVLGGNLTLTMTDLRDPVTVGKKETYLIEVKNGSQVDHNVVLSVTLPDKPVADGLPLIPVPVETSGSTKIGKISGQTIEFEPVAQLYPNQSVTYRVVVKAMVAGAVEVTAHVRSQNVRGEVSRTEKTDILEK
jgi:hypothetical protein